MLSPIAAAVLLFAIVLAIVGSPAAVPVAILGLIWEMVIFFYSGTR